LDGAGSALVIDSQPAALVGSSFSNGDCIVETLQQTHGIAVPVGEPIEGLLDAADVPPPHSEPTYRFAVKGATTRLGGVLREATSDFAVSKTHQKAACVGDYIEYGNGSRSQIVTGVGLPETPNFRALAVVGSLLENGDVITDSPDRRDHTVAFVPVDSAISIHRSGVSQRSTAYESCIGSTWRYDASTGGFVMAFKSGMHDHGKKIAISGDRATCGNCEGGYPIYGPVRVFPIEECFQS
jgi:uncharacterized Zn-binding protein involved in type VI secretion